MVVSMKVSEVLSLLESYFCRFGLGSARSEAEQLIEHVTGYSRNTQILSEREISSEQWVQLQNMSELRVQGRPLQLLVGKTCFYGLEVAVREGVLIPRPETEVLVYHVLSEKLPERARILDVGTGSGAVALAIQSERPNWEVWASDFDALALDLAKSNAHRLGLPIRCVLGDLFESTHGTFDGILANLPYLPAQDQLHRPLELYFEPDHALYSGTEGLDLARRFLGEVKDHLRDEGVVALELDPRNVDVLAREARNAGWIATVRPDLTGRSRFLMLHRTP